MLPAFHFTELFATSQSAHEQTKYDLTLIWVRTICKNRPARSTRAQMELRAEARFSKVPELSGHILDEITLFVSAKRRRLEARNFAVILTFIPFTTYEKSSFTE